MKNIILKIFSNADWEKAKASDGYAGSADDLRDGFIHLSTPAQIAETLDKHFALHNNLIIAGFIAEDFGSELRWEVSRNGDQFPHLYTTLDVGKALFVKPIALNEHGKHVLPAFDS